MAVLAASFLHLPIIGLGENPLISLSLLVHQCNLMIIMDKAISLGYCETKFKC